MVPKFIMANGKLVRVLIYTGQWLQWGGALMLIWLYCIAPLP